MTRYLSLFIITISVCSCQSAIRNTMYSAYEKVGVQKRDLLKSRVEKARDEQKEGSEDFKDALTHLRELYGAPGGELEKSYDTLRSDYENASKSAEDVRLSIQKMDQVAKDLFVEWEKEIEQMTTASFQADSRRQLRDTKRRYDDLHLALKKSEKSMAPALTRLNDQVLYLKHNLNAQAIGSLRKQGELIQGEILRIIEQVSVSTANADRFIANISNKALLAE